MPGPKAGGIVFDLDGTLVDSLQDIADAVNHCLAERGYPVHSLEAISGMVGHGLAALVESAIPEHAPFGDLLGVVREHYAAHCVERTRLYPGVAELVDALALAEVPMSVVSNKPDPMTQKVVAELFPDDTFTLVLGESEQVPRKPDPTGALRAAAAMGIPAGACLFVGDSPVDLQTAEAAGMSGVAVTWGFRPRDELLAATPTHLIERPGDLLRLAI